MKTELTLHVLKPGEMMLCLEPCLVTTVLGSCVAITLFASHPAVACICHSLLPTKKRGLPDEGNVFRYVDTTIPVMLECMQKHHVPRDEMVVKLFGGAMLTRTDSGPGVGLHVGADNILCAKACLAAAGLKISRSSVGGNRGRRIIFNTQTGEVLQKFCSASRVEAHHGA